MKHVIQSILARFDYRVQRIRDPLPGETIYLVDLFLNLLNTHRSGDVSFIQIGANDGIQEDGIYGWPQRFPWKGVLVEPQPNLASRLRALYNDNSNISIEQSAISDRAGGLTLWYIDDKHPGTTPWASEIASLSYDNLAYHRDKIPNFDAGVRSTKVDAITLDDLLTKHRIDALDLLVMDTGGHDARIVESIDFGRIKPSIIVYESDYMQHQEAAKCRSLLSEQGYMFATVFGDTIACLPEILPKRS